MVLNTPGVVLSVTPTIIGTYFSHFLNRKPLHQKPTAHISYHEGVSLVRQFLNHASHHTVEEFQAFTSQWVPSPSWIRTEEITIPVKQLEVAAEALCAQLGRHGIDRVGGEKWWRWRRVSTGLKAEWVEMRRDYQKWKRNGTKSNRVILYVHGGAFFFGSPDVHRYQLQRHARKLEARVLAPRYRLAPQYPFPCGLQDCLSAYLYLLTIQEPSEIILAGDSAGGGMVVSMLITLRDQGIPLPAGAILISPWVDLTHSFPSVAGDGSRDYIPAHGFLQRPSASWPPPNEADMEEIAKSAVKAAVDKSFPHHTDAKVRKSAEVDALQGFTASEMHAVNANASLSPSSGEKPNVPLADNRPAPDHKLSISLDGKFVTITDQIQMYTTNQLLSHPLVSPILQPSLGGLPPLFVMTGGGEVLRDEQIYLAHKAANPSTYPCGDAYLEAYPNGKELLTKWRPTEVQLQVWDDLCHVTPTLSFTRPAKYMFRSVAQFGAWALARAQKTSIDIQDDDEMSVISGSESDAEKTPEKDEKPSSTVVGRAGDPLPPFKEHMIRQRVDRHGAIFSLDPPSSLPALNIPPNEIGVIKPGPVRKWLTAKTRWDRKYESEKRKVQRQRAKEMALGYTSFGNDEVPPPSALAGRQSELTIRRSAEPKRKRGWGLSLWSLWGSSHDENTIEREEKADRENEDRTADNGQTASTTETKQGLQADMREQSRSKSRRRTVTYSGQDINGSGSSNVDENTPVAELVKLRAEHDTEQKENPIADSAAPEIVIEDGTTSDAPALAPKGNSARPAAGGQAFPFKLSTHLKPDGANASTVTLMSQKSGVVPQPSE